MATRRKTTDTEEVGTDDGDTTTEAGGETPVDSRDTAPAASSSGGDAPRERVQFKLSADETITCEVTHTHENGLVDLQEILVDETAEGGERPGRWFQNISRDQLKNG